MSDKYTAPEVVHGSGRFTRACWSLREFLLAKGCNRLDMCQLPWVENDPRDWVLYVSVAAGDEHLVPRHWEHGDFGVEIREVIGKPQIKPVPPKLSDLSHHDLASRLQRIAELCRKHNHAGVNTGAHALAAKVLKIVEGT